jgi:hypothetical protein
MRMVIGRSKKPEPAISGNPRPIIISYRALHQRPLIQSTKMPVDPGIQQLIYVICPKHHQKDQLNKPYTALENCKNEVTHHARTQRELGLSAGQ